MKRNYPVVLASKLDRAADGPVEIVGPLCTPLDRIGRAVDLPEPEPGDVVAVFMSGAYARAASPLGFLSHDTPAEVMVRDGAARVVRRRGRPDDLLRDQPDALPPLEAAQVPEAESVA